MTITGYAMAALGGLLLIALIYIGVDEYRIQSLKTDVANYKAQMPDFIAQQNATAAKQEQAQENVNEAAIVAKLHEDQVLSKSLTEDEDALRNAPKSDDGSVAPVLARAINQLH